MFLCEQEDWVLCRVFYKSRTTIAKLPTEGSYNNIDSVATTSLPPLTDNYIAFDQPGSMQNLEGYEQVPCFSNNPSQQPSSSMNVPLTSAMVDQEQNNMGRAIKDVLSQFTKFEGNVKREALQSNFSQDGFDYLAESGFTQMWNSLSWFNFEGDIYWLLRIEEETLKVCLCAIACNCDIDV